MFMNIDDVSLAETDGFVFYSEGMIKQYKGNAKEVKIPQGTTFIGGSAFEGNSTMETLDIPISVAGIGEYAFKDCKALKNLNNSNYDIVILKGAFAGCDSLSNIKFPTRFILSDHIRFMSNHSEVKAYYRSRVHNWIKKNYKALDKNIGTHDGSNFISTLTDLELTYLYGFSDTPFLAHLMVYSSLNIEKWFKKHRVCYKCHGRLSVFGNCKNCKFERLTNANDSEAV